VTWVARGRFVFRLNLEPDVPLIPVRWVIALNPAMNCLKTGAVLTLLRATHGRAES
jgi:hypothetical protein